MARVAMIIARMAMRMATMGNKDCHTGNKNGNKKFARMASDNGARVAMSMAIVARKSGNNNEPGWQEDWP